MDEDEEPPGVTGVMLIAGICILKFLESESSEMMAGIIESLDFRDLWN